MSGLGPKPTYPGQPHTAHSSGSGLEVLRAESQDEVFTHRLLSGVDQELIPRYSDDHWNLYALEPGRAIARTAVVRFDVCPDQFVAAAKRLAWIWINVDTPLHLLNRKTAARPRLSPITIAELIRTDVSYFFHHLTERGVRRLSDVSQLDFNTFVIWVSNRGWGRERQHRALFTVSRVWLASIQMPEEDRLPIPTWEVEGIDEVIGTMKWSAENKTVPIHPETMSQLLVWALRYTEDFADDIFRADQARAALQSRTPTGTVKENEEAFRALIDLHAAQGSALPGYTTRSLRLPAADYIAESLRIRRWVVSRMTMEAGLPFDAPAPLDSTILGRLPGDDGPWTDAIDYYQVREQKSQLAIACLIVTAYLSGMRGQEVTELRRGCCIPLPHDEGQPERFAITGREYKSAIDAQGNRVLGGRIRNVPWIVIEPVARAIRIMERLSESDFLFDHAVFKIVGPELENKAVLVSKTWRHFKDFIARVNAFCDSTGRPQHRIPTDPHGLLSLRRMRRTLAWFIYRQPYGRVATGIQYGHIRASTADGYGSRSSAGLRGIFTMEQALSLADSLSEAADRLAEGEKVSGPAALRYIEGIESYRERFAGKRLTPRQLNALSRNPRLRIFDSGLQPVACCYDATKALCHPDNVATTKIERSPDLTRCDPRCGNVARTDTHVATLREELAQLMLESESPSTPYPLQERAKQRIASLKLLIDRHDTTKVGP